MSDIKDIQSRLRLLKKSLSKDHFNNKKPKYNSKKKSRKSIYKLEKKEDYLKKVILVQSLTRRWLAKVHTYKIKNNIPLEDEILDRMVKRIRELRGCSTLEALKVLNEEMNF